MHLHCAYRGVHVVTRGRPACLNGELAAAKSESERAGDIQAMQMTDSRSTGDMPTMSVALFMQVWGCDELRALIKSFMRCEHHPGACGKSYYEYTSLERAVGHNYVGLVIEKYYDWDCCDEPIFNLIAGSATSDEMLTAAGEKSRYGAMRSAIWAGNLTSARYMHRKGAAVQPWMVAEIVKCHGLPMLEWVCGAAADLLDESVMDLALARGEAEHIEYLLKVGLRPSAGKLAKMRAKPKRQCVVEMIELYSSCDVGRAL